MSQVLRYEFFFFATSVDLLLYVIECGSQGGVSGWGGRHNLCKLRAQEPGVAAGKEQSYAQTVRGDPIGVAMRNAFDDPVQTQAAEVVGHFADGVMGLVETQQWSE